jgi:hypothetical protein
MKKANLVLAHFLSLCEWDQQTKHESRADLTRLSDQKELPKGIEHGVPVIPSRRSQTRLSANGVATDPRLVGSPATSAEIGKRFENCFCQLTKGKESGKVRIVLEQGYEN